MCKNTIISCEDADVLVECCGASKQMGYLVQMGVITASVLQNQCTSYDSINM